MKKINLAITPLFLLSVVLIGCSPKAPKIQFEKVENIVRLMVIERGDSPEYIFYTRNPNNPNELVYNNFRLVMKRAKVITDVPPNQDMWALKGVRVDVSIGGSARNHSLEIHIHSEKDIDGSTWREHCGRNCTRTVNTQVIE